MCKRKHVCVNISLLGTLFQASITQSEQNSRIDKKKHTFLCVCCNCVHACFLSLSWLKCQIVYLLVVHFWLWHLKSKWVQPFFMQNLNFYEVGLLYRSVWIFPNNLTLLAASYNHWFQPWNAKFRPPSRWLYEVEIDLWPSQAKWVWYLEYCFLDTSNYCMQFLLKAYFIVFSCK